MQVLNIKHGPTVILSHQLSSTCQSVFIHPFIHHPPWHIASIIRGTLTILLLFMCQFHFLFVTVLIIYFFWLNSFLVILALVVALACLVAGHDPLQQAERQPGQEALAFDEALAREQLQSIIILLNGQHQQQQQGGNYYPPAIGSPSPIVVPSPSPYPSQQRPVVAHQQNAPMPVAPTYSAIPMVSSTAVARQHHLQRCITPDRTSSSSNSNQLKDP